MRGRPIIEVSRAEARVSGDLTVPWTGSLTSLVTDHLVGRRLVVTGTLTVMSGPGRGTGCGRWRKLLAELKQVPA